MKILVDWIAQHLIQIISNIITFISPCSETIITALFHGKFQRNERKQQIYQ